MRRPGGFSDEQIQAAFDAVAAALSPDDLVAAADEHPALSAPVVHAYLRQERQQLEAAGHPLAAGLRARLDDLFTILHWRHHNHLVTEARGAAGDAAERDQYMPALMRSIVEALDRYPLPLGGKVRHPSRDIDAIHDDVAEVLGRRVSLPPYAPPPGSAWALLVVRCAACEQLYLLARAQCIDLLASPELAAEARAGRINWSACPRCGTALCVPVRDWLADDHVRDGLEALSAVWRVRDGVLVFQPPPGTPRDRSGDRIMEMLTERIERGHAFAPTTAGHADDGVSSRAIAYTPSELGSYIARAAIDDEPGGLPLAMEVRIGELARKLREGVLRLDEAERVPPSLVASHWPVWIPDFDLLHDDPHHFVAIVLTIEAVAAQADEPNKAMQAVLRRLAAAGYLRLEEHAMSERAVEQAEALLAELPAPPPVLRGLILEARGDLLRAEDRAEEAARFQEEVASLVLDGMSPLAAQLIRLARATTAALEAFDASGAHAEALQAYPALVQDWEALLDQLRHDPSIPAAGLGQATETFSGCLDNYAMAVKDVANAVRQRQVLADATLTDEERGEALLWMPPANHRVDDDRFPSALAAATRATGTATAEGLYQEARRLVIRALGLAEDLGAWGFAAIQGIHLSRLHHVLGDAEQARAQVCKAIDHAARSGHHWEAADGRALLFLDAFAEGDVTQALAQFELAALDTLRGMIRAGFGQTSRMSTSIPGMAMMLIEHGADPLRVAAVVESVRSARMANSMEQGLPGSAPDAETQALLREREQAQIAGDGDAAARISLAIRERGRKRGSLDGRFGPWIDTTTVGLVPPEEMQAAVAELGPRATWITVLIAGSMVASLAVWAGGAGAQINEVALPPDGVWSPADLARVGEGLLGPHPHLANLRPGDPLIISLPSELTGVPAGALMHEGAPLCTRCSPMCIHGFWMYQASRARHRDGLHAALLLGAPHRPELHPLPGAEAEVSDVAGLLEAAGIRADVLVGEDATTRAFLGAATAHDVVHVACHANSDGLMLCADPTHGESGWLREDRVLGEVELVPGTLVNLAGCRTGHAAELYGPVMRGLVPSFLVAGAGCVIASLWPVKDDATARLQLGFYRYLTTGENPGAALARAQTDAWSGRLGADAADPAVWGAFVGYGAS